MEKVRISPVLIEKVADEVKRLNKKSQKQYVEECVSFFTSRELDPGDYQFSMESNIKDFIKRQDEEMMISIKETLEHISRIILHQHNTILKNIYKKAAESIIYDINILNTLNAFIDKNTSSSEIKNKIKVTAGIGYDKDMKKVNDAIEAMIIEMKKLAADRQ